MLYTLRFFLSSKCSLFHNANLFGSCIIHILYTGCAEIKKNNNSGAKGLMSFSKVSVFFVSAHFNLRKRCPICTEFCFNVTPLQTNSNAVLSTCLYSIMRYGRWMGMVQGSLK